MIEYTKEEYKKLLHITRPYRPWFADLLAQTILEKPFVTYISPYGGIQKKYPNMKKCLRERYPNRYHLMYEVPFEDLPLHINEKGLLSSMIFKWRLLIGK